jgi:hypothetical protein
MPKQRVLLIILLFVISAQITRGQEPKPSPTPAPAGQEPKTGTGVPPGFQPSENPHSVGGQIWTGRRNKTSTEEVNQVANVTDLKAEKEVIYLTCTLKSDLACAGDEMKIRITTEAEDKEGDILTYEYTVGAGKIIGQGANVVWDLSGVPVGQYSITAGVNDGCGICGKTMTKTVEIKAVTDVESVNFSVAEIASWCPLSRGPESICSKEQMIVQVKTTSRNVTDDLTYYYAVTGGTIVGNGASVKWDLRDTRPGTYTLSVGIGKNNIILGKIATNTISEKTCGACDMGCECATISASGPADIVKPGDTIVFTSKVGGLDGKLSYKWMVSAGTILNDPTSSSIMVKIPADFKEGEFLATFQLDGTNPACNCLREVTVTVRMSGTKTPPEREL